MLVACMYEINVADVIISSCYSETASTHIKNTNVLISGIHILQARSQGGGGGGGGWGEVFDESIDPPPPFAHKCCPLKILRTRLYSLVSVHPSCRKIIILNLISEYFMLVRKMSVNPNLFVCILKRTPLIV